MVPELSDETALDDARVARVQRLPADDVLLRPAELPDVPAALVSDGLTAAVVAEVLSRRLRSVLADFDALPM